MERQKGIKNLVTSSNKRKILKAILVNLPLKINLNSMIQNYTVIDGKFDR